MITNYSIREVRKDDMDQLIELCESHAKFEESEYNSVGKSLRLAALLFCEEPPLKCVVAEMDEELIGYSTFMKQFSTWDAAYYVYMDCLYLKDSARGHGIGKELMDQVVNYADTEFCKQIQWHTPTFNTRAIKFYRNYGAYSRQKERFFLDL